MCFMYLTAHPTPSRLCVLIHQFQFIADVYYELMRILTLHPAKRGWSCFVQCILVCSVEVQLNHGQATPEAAEDVQVAGLVHM